MDDPNLATAAHESISSFLSTLRFLRRHAPFHSAVATLLDHPSTALKAGEFLQDTRNMVNLGGHLADPGRIFNSTQKINLQKISIALSTISVCTCIVMLYMSWMAKKNFRRNLIGFLLLGDFFKSVWYLLFASFSLSVGGIATDSSFCQANGFLLQTAVESCDAAILFMSLHMYLQIFSPTSKTFGHDGLYRFRHTVMGIYCAFPLLSASLAFVNSDHGYISQGPFCTLPIRPFWYRLALTWIPRYLIWLYIMFVSVRIYLHVGNGFKVFARQQDRISSGDADAESSLQTSQELHVVKKESVQSSMGSSTLHENINSHSALPETPIAPTDRERRRSSINWPPAFNTTANSEDCPPISWSGSRRGSRVAFQGDNSIHVDFLQVPPEQKLNGGSISTISSFRTTGDMSTEANRPAGLAPIEESRPDLLEDGPDAMSADTPLKKRRRAIQRQLRLLFIYPSIYMIMWTIPFVYHSMNYSDHYAQHPIYELGLVALICQTALGSVDCLVFGWREKPWKHIPGSDGTFLGAFQFWRFGGDGVRIQWTTPAPGQIPNLQDAEHQEQLTAGSRPRSFMRSSSYTSIRPMMHRKTFSGSSDTKNMNAERAAERLALERAEREERGPAHSRSASVNTNNKTTEWWERRLSQAVHDTPANEHDGFDFDDDEE